MNGADGLRVSPRAVRVTVPLMLATLLPLSVMPYGLGVLTVLVSVWWILMRKMFD
jgi:hypothetical protein